jgi:predicted small secreted protein
MKYVTLLLLMSVFALSGCETVKGVGKDLEKAGQSIEKAAS